MPLFSCFLTRRCLLSCPVLSFPSLLLLREKPNTRFVALEDTQNLHPHSAFNSHVDTSWSSCIITLASLHSLLLLCRDQHHLHLLLNQLERSLCWLELFPDSKTYHRLLKQITLPFFHLTLVTSIKMSEQEQATEMVILPNPAPAKASQAGGEKKLSLIDAINESPVADPEKGGDDLKTLEAAEAGVDGATVKKTKVKKGEGRFKVYIKARDTGVHDEGPRSKFEFFKIPDCSTPRETRPGFFAKVGDVLKQELIHKPVAFWSRSKDAVILTLAVTVACLVAAVVTLSVVTVNGKSSLSPSSPMHRNCTLALLRPNLLHRHQEHDRHVRSAGRR